MGQRMFVSVVPPEDVVADLADFLRDVSVARVPRPAWAVRGRPRPSLEAWIDPAQWHLTLAFMASVPGARQDELIDRLGEAAARVAPFDVVLGGAGCFPDPTRATVLWVGVDAAAGESLTRLATGARAAANVSGATPDGKDFVAHLTLARLKRAIEATTWLRVLDTWRSRPWRVAETTLVASHLHEGAKGRPRHDVVARLPLAR